MSQSNKPSDTLVVNTERAGASLPVTSLDDAIKLSKEEELALWVYEQTRRETLIQNAIALLSANGYDIKRKGE